MADETDVRRIAMALPAVTERPSYGTPGFRVRDRLFARLREDDATVVLWCSDEGEKRALLAADGAKFTTTPHYDGHPIVLVVLAAVAPDELAELIAESWRVRAPRRLAAGHPGPAD